MELIMQPGDCPKPYRKQWLGLNNVGDFWSVCAKFSSSSWLSKQHQVASLLRLGLGCGKGVLMASGLGWKGWAPFAGCWLLWTPPRCATLQMQPARGCQTFSDHHSASADPNPAVYLYSLERNKEWTQGLFFFPLELFFCYFTATW